MKATSSTTGGKPPHKPAIAKAAPQPKKKLSSPASKSSVRKPTIRFEYDVCVSFAGENREVVQDVVGSLKRRRIKCFYDFDEQATLLGKNLFTYLDEVYRVKARFCIMFISEHYPLKLWTNHERQSIQARMFESKDDYLIPVRLDDTEVPGVLSTLGYIDGRRHSTSEVAALIQQKVQGKVKPKKPTAKLKAGSSAKSVNWTYMTNLRKLRKALTDPVTVAVLDITASRPGQKVLFNEILRLTSAVEARRVMTALALLTKTIKREFNLPVDKVTWPVERHPGTGRSDQVSYQMSVDVAQAWLKSGS